MSAQRDEEWADDLIGRSRAGEAKWRKKSERLEEEGFSGLSGERKQNADREAEERRKFAEKYNRPAMEALPTNSVGATTMQTTLTDAPRDSKNSVEKLSDATMRSLRSFEERASELIQYDDSNLVNKTVGSIVIGVAAGLIARRFGLVHI